MEERRGSKKERNCSFANWKFTQLEKRHETSNKYFIREDVTKFKFLAAATAKRGGLTPKKYTTHKNMLILSPQLLEKNNTKKYALEIHYKPTFVAQI